MKYELQCPKCRETFRTDSSDFKYCPYCSVALDRIEQDFVPLDSGQISFMDKINAFDSLFIMAKNHFNNLKKSYENDEDCYCTDDDCEYMFEAVMELLGIGIEDGCRKMWETYNKYSE